MHLATALTWPRAASVAMGLSLQCQELHQAVHPLLEPVKAEGASCVLTHTAGVGCLASIAQSLLPCVDCLSVLSEPYCQPRSSHLGMAGTVAESIYFLSFTDVLSICISRVLRTAHASRHVMHVIARRVIRITTCHGTSRRCTPFLCAFACMPSPIFRSLHPFDFTLEFVWLLHSMALHLLPCSQPPESRQNDGQRHTDAARRTPHAVATRARMVPAERGDGCVRGWGRGDEHVQQAHEHLR